MRLAGAAVVGIVLLAGTNLFAISTARAALGGTESSIETDLHTLHAVRHPQIKKDAYVVHEMANQYVTVRQYVSNNVVFAIAWEGKTTPDLKGLLGDYFKDFSRAASRTPKLKGKRPFSRIEGDHVVVEKFGHMRAVKGKAYLRGMMPVGVSANDIR